MVVECGTQTGINGEGRDRAGGRERDVGTGAPAAAEARCVFVRDLVACAFGIDARAMRSATRQRAPVAYARQVAMYLAHVTCGLTLSDVGRAFGRDRTTVAHACQVVEDRRDEPDMDMALEYLEAAIAGWLHRQDIFGRRAGGALVSIAQGAGHADG